MKAAIREISMKLIMGFLNLFANVPRPYPVVIFVAVVKNMYLEGTSWPPFPPLVNSRQRVEERKVKKYPGIFKGGVRLPQQCGGGRRTCKEKISYGARVPSFEPISALRKCKSREHENENDMVHKAKQEMNPGIQA
ncbi:hypothetical protein MferCBS31731_002378 [Microsporum ferrugineum]